nr:MAG TPA: hypothetical protein [Caudoviricetes sp.]
MVKSTHRRTVLLLQRIQSKRRKAHLFQTFESTLAPTERNT